MTVLFMGVALAAPVISPPQYYFVDVELSRTTLSVGQTLFINVTTTAQNNTTAFIRISSLDSGIILYMKSGNVSKNRTFQAIFSPHKPVGFGEYAAYAQIGNSSASRTFTLQPSLMDMYGDLDKIQQHMAQIEKRDAFVTTIMMPYGLLVCSVILFGVYFLWRIPSPDKDVLRDWLLTKLDIMKLRRLKKDFRDLDRLGYETRQFRTVGANEKLMASLRAKKQIIINLADSIGVREEKLKKRAELAEKFRLDLIGAARAVDSDIAKYEEATTGAIKDILLEATRDEEYRKASLGQDQDRIAVIRRKLKSIEELD
jgi:hypothetical protein